LHHARVTLNRELPRDDDGNRMGCRRTMEEILWRESISRANGQVVLPQFGERPPIPEEDD